MYEKALSFLKEVSNLGYKAYIVGGYPRDKYLNKKTDDIDICTNMTPREMKEHFKVIDGYEKYGSMRILYQDTIFEVTTFRKEGQYKDLRRPEEVTFVDSLEEDLKRRDFTINTLCIDAYGEYVDLLNARLDMDNKIIKVVGNPYEKLTEDPTRILRALRLKINLNFHLDEEIIKVIKENKDLLKKISDYRKEEELNKCKEKEKLQNILENLTK
jgi:tRNA nucleotidyltransferase (CCA-adding enzyme)